MRHGSASSIALMPFLHIFFMRNEEDVFLQEHGMSALFHGHIVFVLLCKGVADVN